MIWAAQKEPAIQFASVAAGQELYNMRADQPPTAKLVMSNSGPPADSVAHVTVNDQYGHLVDQFDHDFAVPQGESELEIPLSGLYGGLHLVDIIVKNEAGAVANWATVPVHVEAPVSIASLEVADKIYRRNDSVTPAVELKSIEPELVAVTAITTLTDAYGRELVHTERAFAAPGTAELSLELPEPLTTTALLRVALYDDEGLLDAAEQKILTMPEYWDSREWGPFRSGAFGSPVGAYSREYLQHVRTERFKGVGIDTVLTYMLWPESGEHRTAFEAGFRALQFMDVTASILEPGQPRREGHLKFAEQRDEYAKTHDKQYLQRPWCLNAADTREYVAAWVQKHMPAVAKYRPLGYVCGDELSLTYYANPFDYDFTPVCLEKFRQWLESEYGSLAALNAEWSTDFATWADIMPMTAEEVHGRDNYAPWADHRTFMEITYANFFRWTDRTLENYDPGARIGISGSEPASAYGGCDWWRLTDALDFIQAYDSANAGEMHRSFHDMLAASWYPYGNVGVSLEHLLWRRLLNDNRGCMYFQKWLLMRPDYTYTQRAIQAKEYIEECRGGLARLLHECDARAADVYIHYSHPSIHAAFITGGETIFKNNRNGWIKAIEDSDMQMQFISYAQLQAGELTELMPPVFVLPYSVALSDAEAAELWQYVQGGSMLIADARCGLMDEHCKLRPRGVLDDLFGIERSTMDPKGKRVEGEVHFANALGECDPRGIEFEDVLGERAIKVTTGTPLGEAGVVPLLVVHPVGKGRAVLLNMFMDGYPRRRGLKVEAPLRELMHEVLELGGVEPFARVDTGDEHYVYVARYCDGKASYIGVLRDAALATPGFWPGREVSEQEAGQGSYVRVKFPYQAHLYDLRRGKYLGKTDRDARLIGPGYCQMYSLLPYRVCAVEVMPRAKTKAPGKRVSYRLRIITDGPPPGLHVLRVQVAGPDGVKDYYGTQITARNGLGKAYFDLALNDPPGTWTITATDIATGVAGKSSFEVGE